MRHGNASCGCARVAAPRAERRLALATVTRAASAVLTPALMRQWALAAADALAEHAQQINELNVFPVPDADTGTNSSLTFRAGLDALADLPAESDLPTIARVMGRAAAFGARGNSGVILSQMLSGILDAAVDPTSPVDGIAMARILRSVADAGREAVADPRDGTMLTVAADAATAAHNAAEIAADLVTVCVAAADAARASLLDTPNHLAELAAAGVVDAGGRAVVVVLDALAEVMTGQPRPEWTAPVLTRSCDMAALKAAYRGPAYEVMFVLRAPTTSITDVQSQLVNLGDSLAVVGGDDVWNVHIHVDDPAAALAIGRAAGQIQDIRISYLLDGAATDAILMVLGVDGDLETLATDAGAVVIDEDDVTRARDAVSAELTHRGGGTQSVLLISHGSTAGLSRQWWKDAGITAEVAVVSCAHAPQVVAALAVCDVTQPVAETATSMVSAVGAMRCGTVTVTPATPSSTSGATWALPGWKSGTADEVLSAFAHIVSELVSHDTELVTVTVGTDSTIDDAELTGIVRDASPNCDVYVFHASMSGVTVCIGVE